MAGTWTLQFPFRRSVGPVIGGFLAGLRDQRVVGATTAGGRVLVPPLEYDPDTGEATTGEVEVAAAGVVEHAAWVAEPLRTHPSDQPFAWVLVKLDGADTSLLHIANTNVSVGDRVQIHWRDEREGKITDIEYFEAAQ
jgi:uncharacterized OB-fold protein